jgi:2-alkenal reductase
MSWAQVAREAGPAVVTVVNQLKPQQGLFGYAPAGTGEGSGFVIDHKGDIVTNNHVVDQAQSLQVVFANGKKANAQLVRADPLSDLAVVHVSVPVTTVLRFGDSNALQPGQPVMAIGSALGEYRNTVTAGVVSALGRTIQEPPSANFPAGVSLHNMLQTDTAINQGNSGGPLLNDRGEVVGVNTLISRGAQQTNIFGAGSSVVAEGLGFAIPSSTVSNVAARLVQNKPPAFLGVQYHPISQQEATYYGLPLGAYVNAIRPNSPASRAGLRQRDVITKIGGQPINDTYSLEQVVAEHTRARL